MKRVAILVVLALAGLGAANRAPTVAHAATLTVCQTGSCTFGSIQAAIGAAHPGDTILVRAGCYFENVDIEGFVAPGITIMGAGPGPHTPVSASAAPSASDPCLVAPYTTTAGTYIDGMCDDAPTVYVFNATVTIEGVTIQDGCLFDLLNYNAAGLWNDQHSSTLLQNSWIFANANYADCRPSGESCNGGFFNNYDSALQLTGDQIVNNYSVTSGAGGMNVSETGYAALPPDTAPRSTTPHTATRPPNRGGAVNAIASLRPAPGSHVLGAGPGVNGHGHSKNTSGHRLAGALTTAGSQVGGTGLYMSKTTVNANANEYGTGGVNNAGTAQVSYVNLTNNLGGCTGGFFSGDFNDDATDLSAIAGAASSRAMSPATTPVAATMRRQAA